jgi:hypothetical protein
MLRKLFERLSRWYKLRFKLAKYSFGVKSVKFLGFMVTEKWIEVDHDKVKVI